MSKIHTLLSSATDVIQNDLLMMVATKKDFLTPDECAPIIKFADKQEFDPAGINNDNEIIQSTRKSKVTYLPLDDETEWLYSKLGVEIQEVNDQAYHYDLAGIEEIQLACYDEGEFYDWHIDLGAGDNSTRKLSLSIQLTPPNEYDGGELEFMKIPEPSAKEQGAIIFFPSFLHHQVKPVTRGRRYSIVAWVHGNAFR